MPNDTFCPLPSLPSSYTVPSKIRHGVYKTLIRWTPVILSQILRHWFSLCFADASVKRDACYLFKNTVLLMQKSGLVIEFKSDDVMRITFWNYGICWDILRGLLAKNVHFRANCLWDISPVMLRLLHTNPSKFAFVHNLINQTITWLISLRQFALKCQFLASRPFGCFF